MRVLRYFGLAIAVLIVLLLISFALPIHTWRTGELPVAPLPLAPADNDGIAARRLWVDTDAACGTSTTADPDDCLALLLLLRSPGLEIAGISTVHGNAPLDVTDRTTRELVAIATRNRAISPPVHRGSSIPMDQPGSDDDPLAHAALQDALEAGPLTALALRPLTNVATVVTQRPDLRPRISRLVAVMGRRTGHLFHPSEGRGRGILFGHGPVFSDFNVREDPLAVTAVIDASVPLTPPPSGAPRCRRG